MSQKSEEVSIDYKHFTTKKWKYNNKDGVKMDNNGRSSTYIVEAGTKHQVEIERQNSRIVATLLIENPKLESVFGAAFQTLLVDSSK
jgi:hypothetical protein